MTTTTRTSDLNAAAEAINKAAANRSRIQFNGHQVIVFGGSPAAQRVGHRLPVRERARP